MDFDSGYIHPSLLVLIIVESLPNLSDWFDENVYHGLTKLHPSVGKREELMAVLHEKICSKENITPAPDQYHKYGTQDNSRYLHMYHE